MGAASLPMLQPIEPITPQTQDELERMLDDWAGEEPHAMLLAYNLGRRHELARWMDSIDRVVDSLGKSETQG